jgi:hypothetical protein
MTVQIGDANLIVDAIEGSCELIKVLKAQKGYLLTHHCRLGFCCPKKGADIIEYLDSIRLAFRILIGQDLGFGLVDFFYNDKCNHRLHLFGKISQLANCHRLLNWHSRLSGSMFFNRIYLHSVTSKTDKPILDLVHWYNMSNTNQGYVEGSLLLAQVGIELLYNWIICEHLKMVTKKDANRKILAATKLQTLYKHLKIDLERIILPEELNKYKLGEEIPTNAAMVISLRNHLVHSNESHRSRLAKYDSIIFYQARNIQLYIIERYLLAIGSYDRMYYNRLDNNFCDTQDLQFPFE